MLMPESNIHSLKVASTNSVIVELPSTTSKSANRPSPVRASVTEKYSDYLANCSSLAP